jgi:hypothetical protein
MLALTTPTTSGLGRRGGALSRLFGLASSQVLLHCKNKISFVYSLI